jgi:hypothetical protein
MICMFRGVPWVFACRKNQLLTSCVSHCLSFAIYIKTFTKAKEELWKLKHFTMQKYNLQKNPLEETKILQDIKTL